METREAVENQAFEAEEVEDHGDPQETTDQHPVWSWALQEIESSRDREIEPEAGPSGSRKKYIQIYTTSSDGEPRKKREKSGNQDLLEQIKELITSSVTAQVNLAMETQGIPRQVIERGGEP